MKDDRERADELMIMLLLIIGHAWGVYLFLTAQEIDLRVSSN
jgi:hypothetical protein